MPDDNEGISAGTIKVVAVLMGFLIAFGGLAGTHHVTQYKLDLISEQEIKTESKISSLQDKVAALKAFSAEPRYTAAQGDAKIDGLRREVYREIGRSTEWQKEQTQFTKEMIKFTATQEAANKEMKGLLLELKGKVE